MAALTASRKAEIRKFGVGVGTVLIAFTLIASLWTSFYVQAEFAWVLRRPLVGGVGLVLLVLAFVAPSLLDTPERLWMKLAHFLGYWNTRILLTLVFYIVLLPMGLIAWLCGWDELKLRKPEGETFYEKSPDHLLDMKHFEHPF